MQIYHCDHCGQLVFFENISCVKCGHALAFLPDLREISSLEQSADGLYRTPAANGHAYRLCENYSCSNVCNWAVPADDPNPLCRSCRLTRVIPDLSQVGHPEAWYRLEVAKRRLVYSLLTFELPIRSKVEDPVQGLAFEFLSDPLTPEAATAPILTGHDNGLITINLAEANDSERERRRMLMHEPYRTLLGHFRHEIGHYYWDMLIGNSNRLRAFRELFGDEQADYSQALEQHYAQGAPPDWQQSFISAYATAHPWEDWAETWAHYLHMTDALETASACGMSLRPRRANEMALKPNPDLARGKLVSFELMINDWISVTYVHNNLNRGMGLADAYPFVLSVPVIEKLRFVHETITGEHASPPAPAIFAPLPASIPQPA